MANTYDDYFKERANALSKIEAKVARDAHNPYLMREYVNTANGLLFAVMNVVERLADKEEEKEEQAHGTHPLRMTTEERAAAGMPDDGMTDAVRFTIPLDPVGYRAYMALALHRVHQSIAGETGTAAAPIPISITTIQQMIGNWAEKTFPQSTTSTMMRHLWMEMVELDQAVERNKAEEVREEVADIIGIICHLCLRMQIDLETAILAKHIINLKRKWEPPDADGIVYHQKEQN